MKETSARTSFLLAWHHPFPMQTALATALSGAG